MTSIEHMADIYDSKGNQTGEVIRHINGGKERKSEPTDEEYADMLLRGE